MSDSYTEPQNNFKKGEANRDRPGRGRGYGGRDTGGFRIRLSDNEMRSARALQEAFNLRSTVAVLGFAIRTLGQMLEEGKLSELIEEQKLQVDRRGNYNQGGGARGRFNDREKPQPKGAKPNPFARPAKPEPQKQQEALLGDQDHHPENQTKDEQAQDESGSSQGDATSKESQENNSTSLEGA